MKKLIIFCYFSFSSNRFGHIDFFNPAIRDPRSHAFAWARTSSSCRFIAIFQNEWPHRKCKRENWQLPLFDNSMSDEPFSRLRPEWSGMQFLHFYMICDKRKPKFPKKMEKKYFWCLRLTSRVEAIKMQRRWNGSGLRCIRRDHPQQICRRTSFFVQFTAFTI